ncbi:glycosyltransferase family 1 protein [Candidatus Gracilibacteria bacterium]|nr:glycosyltransferase family 1 protein [Candidatus Gracilibacteria bacterium]
MKEERIPLICLAHLDWDHVWQRPQQLMTRLTRHFDVVYIDPPHMLDGLMQPELRALRVDQGVRVYKPCFPHVPAEYWQYWKSLLPTVLAAAGAAPVLWVYSPLSDRLVEQLADQSLLAVYDCMDDLASFRGASAEMRIREERLLGLVDLVFTGGKSIYEARQARHAHVYCFPSGVDVEHYGQAYAEQTAIADAIATIPHPQLGYFGVLDERIDWPLIAAIAARRPEWHWTLVGPTAKVTPEELPRAANIHYLGKQAYTDLPTFLKSFDIATMPFALNAATRFISPTKTPEYLAGGKWGSAARSPMSSPPTAASSILSRVSTPGSRRSRSGFKNP